MTEKRWICAYPAANLYLKEYKLHLKEIKKIGFTTVVLCIPEHYLLFSMNTVGKMIGATREVGLECWADPWGVAGVFDGEAPHRSVSDTHGVVGWWIDSVGSLEPDAIFLDNPFPGIPSLIADWGSRAHDLGMGCQVNLSCHRHCWDLDLFRRVASLDSIDGIGTDPYCLGRMESFDVDVFVGTWAERLAEIGRASGKPACVWVQGFNIPDGMEDFPVRAVEVALRWDIQGIGFWGYRACESFGISTGNSKKIWATFGTWLSEYRISGSHGSRESSGASD